MNTPIITGTKRSTLLALALVFLCLPLTTLLSNHHASALSGGDFNAGHIIDDTVFTNYNALSVSDIQNFLNAKVGTCDNNGTGSAAPFNSSMTRAQYDASIGKNTSFTCINQYYENTTTLANNLDGNPIPSGAISAAQIIYNAAHQYQINPEVIIATIQKEQGLVTDTWPWDSEYQKALGYACPDTAPCNTQYYGFYNQVTSAAWQFRQYLTYPNNYNYVVGTDYILWSPAGGCGGANVSIQNQATAALYDYTPYQPNAGALSGVSDSSPGSTSTCGSYGNRNFWWYFNEWFGSSLAPPFGARYFSQSSYPTIVQGQSANVTLAYENVGNTPWYDSTNAAANGQYQVDLATFNPINRGSGFYSPSWASASRPATTFTAVYESDGTTLAPNQHEVMPGEVASYTFQVTAPRNAWPGTYYEYFLPIREGAPGAGWFMGADTVHMDITIQRADKAQYVGQSAYPTIDQNDSSNAYFEFKNTGTANWYDSTDAASNGEAPVELVTAPLGRPSGFSATWPSPTVAANTFAAVYESDGTTLAVNQHVVQPGQIVKFSFAFTAGMNISPATYREYFLLDRYGSAPDWLVESSGVYLDVTVKGSQLKAAYSSESGPLSLQRGQSGTMFFNFKNVGNVAWYDDTSKTAGIKPIHLATTWPINRASVFYDPSWASVSRPDLSFTKVYESDGTTLASNQHVVQPGQIAQFAFKPTAASNLALGAYAEHFQPIVEGAPGALWDMSASVWQSVQVTQ